MKFQTHPNSAADQQGFLAIAGCDREGAQKRRATPRGPRWPEPQSPWERQFGNLSNPYRKMRVFLFPPEMITSFCVFQPSHLKLNSSRTKLLRLCKMISLSDLGIGQWLLREPRLHSCRWRRRVFHSLPPWCKCKC